MASLERVDNVYRTELLARLQNYSVSPKRPQPEQTADRIRQINQQSFASGTLGIGEVYNSNGRKIIHGVVEKPNFDIEA